MQSKPWHREIAPLAVTVLLCVLVATLPHLLAWYQTGSPVWIADHDDLLYLAIGADADHNHPMSLADPMKEQGGDSIYPAAQLVPAVVVSRVFGLSPFLLGLVLRLWAGLALPLALYLLIRRFVKQPWVAASLTLALLFDAGLLFAHLAIRPALLIYQLTLGHNQSSLAGFPQLLWHWRIPSPAASLPFVFLFLFFAVRARAKTSTARILVAGLSFGVLFYLYIYFWTAVGLSLLLAVLIDAGRRRAHLLIGTIGLIAGSPVLIAGYLVTQRNPHDWQARTDYFLHIPHFSEFLIPKLALIALAAIGLIVWRRRNELLPLWLLALSGIVLADHQILTGLQMQNFHWSFVWGPVLGLLLVLAIVKPLVERLPRRTFTTILLLYVTITVGAGFWLRAVEAARTRESVVLTSGYLDFREQSRSLAFEPRAVVAGDPAFVDLAVIGENVRPLRHYMMDVSPAVTDAEWDERIALNAILLGQDRAEFAQTERTYLAQYSYGEVARHPELLDARLNRQLQAFDNISSNLEAALDRFQVGYLALSTADPAPTYLSAGGWELVSEMPSWRIWRRVHK